MKNKAITKLSCFFSNIFYKSWEPAVSVSVSVSANVSVDPWDMLIYFWFSCLCSNVNVNDYFGHRQSSPVSGPIIELVSS